MQYLFKVGSCVMILLFALYNNCSSTPAQPRKLQNLSNNNTSEYTKASLDSTIQEIASSINTITHQLYLSKDDTAKLKDLSSKLSFLCQLSLKIKSRNDNSENNIQQDELSIAILCFGFLIISAILLFQIREKSGISHTTFKLLGIVFIGTVSVFLIPAGFDNNQITPVVGLLGTLAGFLIGTSKSSTLEGSSPNDKKE